MPGDILVYLIVYAISHGNRCEPDGAASALRAVIVSLYTDRNGLELAITNVMRERI